MHIVYNLRCAVSPLGVVAGQLLVCVRGEAVDRVETPLLVEVPELPWCQLPVRVVRDAGQVGCPHVCCAPDVLRSDLDVVVVDQEEQLPELAHHCGGLGGEVSEDADDRLVVLVEKKTSSFELWEERMDSAAHCLQLLEGYVLHEIWHPQETSGLDAVV